MCMEIIPLYIDGSLFAKKTSCFRALMTIEDLCIIIYPTFVGKTKSKGFIMKK
jgi:hypothetical protein